MEIDMDHKLFCLNMFSSCEERKDTNQRDRSLCLASPTLDPLTLP
jgi:hypothetical protein